MTVESGTSDESGEIEHVTDTAFWVASYRALESERSDALFRDPLAALLSGEKGRQIARSMPDARAMAFFMAVRTTAIDRLISSAISHGVGTVLNLGAGLDTRPYRMPLPKELRWIEADFASVVKYKEDKLANMQPACVFERVAIDLSDRAARQALLERVGREAQSVLVITEGVILYLPDDEVGRLAEDVRTVPTIRFWIQDYYGPEPRRHRARLRRKLQAAPFLFQAPDWFGFFAKYGFLPREKISARQEGLRVGRRPSCLSLTALLFLPLGAKWHEKADRVLGYTLLERRGQ
ncbi:MAG TPA: class I SAM-dependent methyltransferase [Polyangiaceae bacterium]|nr:class I SAM-dependent methyltransferase [Polyangiaceae bacterium]